ncbi:MAG: hypothetical protein GY871_05300, partial [Actinomycetales bacterium]|nr:hypothetical protein [Actinomycetales bacterium]
NTLWDRFFNLLDGDALNEFGDAIDLLDDSTFLDWARQRYCGATLTAFEAAYVTLPTC